MWSIHNEMQYINMAIVNLEHLLLRRGFGDIFIEVENNILLGYGYILSENFNDENNQVYY
jgi:hypothetical protein